MEIDQNSYYRLTTAAAMKNKLSMAGTWPYFNNRTGLVTWGFLDNDAPTQQWQLFPVGPSTFMLRTKASGPNGYLATKKGGSVVPQILDQAETDSSMLWRMNARGSGMFYLNNAANGKTLHLDFEGMEPISMSRNTTQSQPGQLFSLVKLNKINNSAFSTVRIPPPSSAISTSPPTSRQISTIDTSVFARTVPTILTSSIKPSSPTSTSTPSSPTATTLSQHQAHQLSPSAAMGVGVAIGVFAIITLTAMSLFIYQRWGPRRPESIHYRRAKQWDGFTPAANGTARPSLGNVSPVGQIYLAELPVGPAAVFSPEVTDRHMSWNNHTSWLEYSPAAMFSPVVADSHMNLNSRASWLDFSSGTPISPQTPTGPPIELPV